MTVCRPFSAQHRRHRLDLPVEELQHQQRLDDVVGVVPSDLVAAQLGGEAVQHAAAQPPHSEQWVSSDPSSGGSCGRSLSPRW
jgi:hypothetical protein